VLVRLWGGAKLLQRTAPALWEVRLLEYSHGRVFEIARYELESLVNIIGSFSLAKFYPRQLEFHYLFAFKRGQQKKTIKEIGLYLIFTTLCVHQKCFIAFERHLKKSNLFSIFFNANMNY
jgi:hypothetical protein